MGQIFLSNPLGNLPDKNEENFNEELMKQINLIWRYLWRVVKIDPATAEGGNVYGGVMFTALLRMPMDMFHNGMEMTVIL